MRILLELELRFLLVSFTYGVVIFAVYDILRIFRAIIKHHFIFIAIEDLLFWIISGVFVFYMIFEKNNGSIRGFSLFALMGGMFLYYKIIGDKLVSLVAGTIKKIFHLLMKPVIYTGKKGKKLVKKVGKPMSRLLKRLRKTFIIALRRK